ncbi:hypothetical protein [Actinomyces slackii]|nr:hypothetical protein [Actinomyces slackii]
MTTATPANRRSRRTTSRTMRLTALLKRAINNQVDPRAILVLPDGTKGRASRILRPLNTITAADSGLHTCLHGRITGYQEYIATRSVFLHIQPTPGTSPRQTAAIMIRADQASAVQDNLDTSIGSLEGHHAIAIGTVRLARTGSLYIELDNTSSLAHLPSRGPVNR